MARLQKINHRLPAGTLETIQKNGCKIKIRHFRIFPQVGLRDGQEIDNVLTKGQYIRGMNEGAIVPRLNVATPPSEFGKDVSNFGGFTTVTIETPSGSTYSGKCNFNKAPFNRRKGLLVAMKRALAKVPPPMIPSILSE